MSAQRSFVGWWRRNWQFAAYGLMVGATAYAARELVPGRIDMGQDLNADPQSAEELPSLWRSSAVLAYTSGSKAGYVCAGLGGVLAAWWGAGRKWWAGPVAAALAGAGLAAANLVASARAAATPLRDEALTVASTGHAMADPGIRHHGFLLGAMAVTIIVSLCAAGIGFGVAWPAGSWVPGQLAAAVVVMVVVVLVSSVHDEMVLSLVR